MEIHRLGSFHLAHSIERQGTDLALQECLCYVAILSSPPRLPTLTGAIRAVFSSSSMSNWSLPLMTLVALPPDLSTGILCKIRKGEISVPVLIPLIYKIGEQRGRISFSSNRLLSEAIRATCTIKAGIYRCFPFMPLLTDPPDPLFWMRQDFVRPDCILRMPFLRDLRTERSEISLSLNYPLSSAEGTSQGWIYSMLL